MKVTECSVSRPRCCKVPRPYKRVHDDHAVAQNHVVVSEVPDGESAKYGAVNYHKVALEGRKCKLVVSPDLAVLPVVCLCCQGRSSGEVNTRGDKQCCSCLEKE